MSVKAFAVSNKKILVQHSVEASIGTPVRLALTLYEAECLEHDLKNAVDQAYELGDYLNSQCKEAEDRGYKHGLEDGKRLAFDQSPDRQAEATPKVLEAGIPGCNIDYPYQVSVRDAGPNKIAAIKAVRSVTYLGLKEAKNLVDLGAFSLYFKTTKGVLDAADALKEAGCTVMAYDVDGESFWPAWPSI